MNGLNDGLRLKLDAFIRKYYQSKLLKGSIYFVGLGLSYFLFVAFLEFIGHFNSEIRFVLLLLLVIGLLAILSIYIVLPLLGIARLGKHLSYFEAAKIIGKHFPDVNDKVTNTLELSNLSDRDNGLIEASINQRIQDLQPIPFVNAIKFGDNKKYWPILVVPILIFFGLWISGGLYSITESSQRIISYSKEFIPEAPFSIVILNDKLSAERGENFDVHILFEGDITPENASLIMDDGQRRFIKNNDGSWSTSVERVWNDFTFKISAAGFLSRAYSVEVLPVPIVKSYVIEVDPPRYTSVKPFYLNDGELGEVPEGSTVKWLANVESVDKLLLKLEDSSYVLDKGKEGRFYFSTKVFNSFSFGFEAENSFMRRHSVLDKELYVIKDAFPQIQVKWATDSNMYNKLFYQAKFMDDYGVNQLKINALSEEKLIYSQKLSVSPSGIISGVLLLDSLAEDYKAVDVFIEVWDNDAVNGSKSSKSTSWKFSLLDRAAIDSLQNLKQETYFNNKKSLNKAKEDWLKELKSLKEKSLNNKKLSWEDKESLKELLRKQEDLLKKQSDLNDERKESDKLKTEEEQKIEALEKEEKKQELEELMKELDALMDKLDMKALREKLDKLEDLSEQNKRSDERIDELLEKLQFKKDVLKEAEKLEELAEKLDELSKTEDASEKEEQEEIAKDFEKSKEAIQEKEKENADFKKRNEEQKLDEDMESADEELQQSSEQMDKKENSKANDSQKKASEDMKKMSQKMQSSLMQMEATEHVENMETLRQLLDNLETLSFDVEHLSDLSKTTDKNDPMFRNMLVDQRVLQEGSKLIEDSLVALSERVPEIEEKVFDELSTMRNNLEKSISRLQEQDGLQAAMHQQYVMTASNELAVLLDAALRQMQQQMANQMKGEQSCQKPGSGKPSLSNMKKMQSELAKKAGGKSGNKKGEESGKKGKGEKGRNGKEIVEMLSRQEQIREELQSYLEDQKGKEGSGSLGDLLKEMEDVEKDMLENGLSPELLQRIKEIETRLLEAEKAEREQGEEERRESISADEKLKQIDKDILEKFLEEKNSEVDQIRKTYPGLRHYYKEQSNKFLE